MSKKDFKVGTEFELKSENYIVTEVTHEGKWIMYDYRDNREITVEERGNMQFMPMSDNWSDSNIL